MYHHVVIDLRGVFLRLRWYCHKPTVYCVECVWECARSVKISSKCEGDGRFRNGYPLAASGFHNHSNVTWLTRQFLQGTMAAYTQSEFVDCAWEGLKRAAYSKLEAVQLRQILDKLVETSNDT